MYSHESRIEQKEEFDFYNIIPETAAILEKIDKERLKVAKVFGLKLKSAEQWLEEAYGAQGKNLYEKITGNKAYQGIKGPKKFNVRQITEDVPYGLVPISLLGKKMGINTPYSDTIITECSFLLNKNFWQTGRTLEKIGLSEMNMKEIKKFVNYGRNYGRKK